MLLYSRVDKAADLWANVANTAKWSLAPQQCVLNLKKNKNKGET